MELYSIRRREMMDSIKTASSTSKITGKSFIYHWIDCIYCIIRFGCGPSQYLEGGFYKLRSFDRDKTYTKKRIDRIRKIFNNKEYERILFSAGKIGYQVELPASELEKVVKLSYADIVEAS